jgi:hypothetical protein
MHQTDDRIAKLLQEYLKRWRDRNKPQNIEMTVFISAVQLNLYAIPPLSNIHNL